jgi:4-hydroxybenzoate polyprenyltransferase
MLSFLKLIRYKNLLMVFLTLVLTKYILINSFTSIFSDFQFILLAITIISITAAGYIINDIYDVEADKINKPSKIFIHKTITLRNAWFAYSFLTAIGLTLGVYTSYINGNNSYSIFFISTVALLYWYSKSLKRIAFIGNIVVSFLTAFPLFIVFVFEVKNTRSATNLIEVIANFISSIPVAITILSYILFAFFMTFIREIIKDIEDINGDYALKMKTLPILIGIQRTKRVVLVVSSFTFLFILIILKQELIHIPILFWYTILFIICPFAWFFYKLFKAKISKDFHLLSTIIKSIMLFGILSMLLIKI